MNDTYGLECQVRYLAEQVNRLTRVLTDIRDALEKKKEEEE